MAEVEEPSTVRVAPCKKRSWSTTLHLRGRLLRQDGGDGSDNYNTMRHDRVSMKDDSNGTTDGSPRPQMAVDQQMDMQGILERYHSLAVAHHSQTKRRRLASAARAAQHSQRVEQLTTLHRMAQDTLHFCTRLLRSEEHSRRENDREQREAEEEMRRAEREKALAEEFLRQFGGNGDGSAAYHHREHAPPHHLMHHAERRMHRAEHANEGQPSCRGTRGMIGGIPTKFLDLSHFPKLQKSFHEGAETHYDVFSPEPLAAVDTKKTGRPLIDCTEEIGIPQEVSLRPTHSKQNTKRIYVSHASLSHVNGTYVQEGRYCDAPLFVRAGPPRKFMGKWDCSIVLRRQGGATVDISDAAVGGVGAKAAACAWKIGLVPAHRVTHPRIIGYYVAVENPAKMVSQVDRMEEDGDDVYSEEEGGSVYLEPPAEGWRVCQQVVDGKDGSVVLGRASSLRVSYEE